MGREELAVESATWKGEEPLQGRNVYPGGKSSGFLLLEIKLWGSSFLPPFFFLKSLLGRREGIEVVL